LTNQPLAQTERPREENDPVTSKQTTPATTTPKKATNAS